MINDDRLNHIIAVYESLPQNDKFQGIEFGDLALVLQELRDRRECQRELEQTMLQYGLKSGA